MLDLLLNIDEAKKIKQRFMQDKTAMFLLNQKAEMAASDTAYSVTFHESPIKSAGKHDFCSEAPYWWPNPENPHGPYVRRDGYSNPSRFTVHKESMESMCKNALTLAIAGFYLDNKAWSDESFVVLNRWFTDDATKMNPHLEFAQSIRGVCEGRGIGIIDTVVLIEAVFACWYLDKSGYDVSLITEWFSRYLNWLRTSEKGINERDQFNNHSNYWNSQVAAYATACNNTDVLMECFDRYKNSIIPNQTDIDGKFIDEVTRTRSYLYCDFNLKACVLICEIAYHNGVDLWNFSTDDGRGVKKSLEFMAPFYKNQFLWPYQQIHGDFSGDKINLQLGSSRLNMQNLYDINKMRRANQCILKYERFSGFNYFLPGF